MDWNSAGVANAPYKKNGTVTPTVVLMFKIANDTLAYASYVESLQQGAIISSLLIYTNVHEMLNPLKSKQWELGIKKDGTRWSSTATLFRMAKTTEYDRSCGADCLIKVQNGESVFQDLELGATARLTNSWSLGGNLMLLDAGYASGDTAIVNNRIEDKYWAYTTHRDPVLTMGAAFRVPLPKDPSLKNHIHDDVTINLRSGALVPDNALKIGSRWFYPMHFSLN